MPRRSVEMTEAGSSLPAAWPAFAHSGGLDGGELSLEVDGRRCVIIGPPLLAQQYNADRRWMAREPTLLATAQGCGDPIRSRTIAFARDDSPQLAAGQRDRPQSSRPTNGWALSILSLSMILARSPAEQS